MCLSEDGNELVPQLIASEPEPVQTYSDAFGYADLGVVSNVNVDRLTVLRGVERSHIDPLIVVPLAHPRLTLHDRIGLYDSIPDCDWLVNLLQRDDGWYWPEYQEAFGQATVGITDERLIPVWVVALSAYARHLDRLPSDCDLPVPQTSRTHELLERLDERWDEHLPGDELFDVWLDSLCVAVNSSYAVPQLAGLIGWGPSQYALACSSRIGSIDVGDLVDNIDVLVRVAVAGNPAIPRHALLALASDEHPSVREMIRRNPKIDDEIRTLAEA